MIPAIVGITAGAYWAGLFGPDEYAAFVLIKYTLMALAFTGWLIDCKRGLVYRSMIAVFAIACWVDLAGYSLDVFAGRSYDSAPIVALGMMVWLVHVARRTYASAGDVILPGVLYLMILRPRGAVEVVRALIGFPVASVCLYADGVVWAFRRASGKYEAAKAGGLFLKNHVAISTGQKATPEIKAKINKLIGTPRFPGVKCVWVIRGILAEIGLKPRWQGIPAMHFCMESHQWHHKR